MIVRDEDPQPACGRRVGDRCLTRTESILVRVDARAHRSTLSTYEQVVTRLSSAEDRYAPTASRARRASRSASSLSPVASAARDQRSKITRRR